MNDVIEHTIDFSGGSSRELFAIFMDPKKHSLILNGSMVKFSPEEGKEFSLLNGNVSGKNLKIVPNRMIVQSWRGNVWNDDDLDSILILLFSDIAGGCRVRLVHACTPTQFEELWEEIYWKPIRKYLANSK
jgi:activator of HSP90 ATPase